tara:strand:+ start:150 stop:323 length:174 start_codon:yes stop_codon:yes gene_type:complete
MNKKLTSEHWNDETRDLAIRIIEMLISELGWDKTDQKEEDWYPFDLQDKIQEILKRG